MDWIKTNDRFVAFFDIMGFKNMINTRDHDDIIKSMDQFYGFAKESENKISSYFPAIKTVMFSDSILLISNNNDIDSAIGIMTNSTGLIAKAIEIGIPLKGSISFGKFTADFDKSLFVGQPLIDAFLLQDELFMYSTIIHHSFESYLNNKAYAEQSFPNNDRWFRYSTPLKNGKAMHYHLNWSFFIEDPIAKEKYRNYIVRFYDSVSGRVRAYVDNTLTLYDEMVKHPK